MRAFPLLFASLFAVRALAAEPVVEFYNALLDHYFLTINPAEAAGIDAGAAGPGWHRTARAFGGYASRDSAPADAVPVCRFYGNVAAGGPNSHFYTADPAECVAVQQDPGWQFESVAFYIRLPAAGQCGAGTTPVLRNYNRRFAQADSNHRYTTDRVIYDEMTAIGWAAESIVFCGDPAIATPPLTTSVASGLSPLAPGCDNAFVTGTVYANAEVEPFLAVNPRAPDNLIGVWQQDRWSNGGARGLVTATSFDGGRSWQKTTAAFSRCTGGTVQNGGNYARATDPWVSIGPDGTAWQIAVGFTGASLTPGSSSAVLVSRSADGGVSWSPPKVLRVDGEQFFNDKQSITADPVDPRYVYAAWDRLDQASGPSWFARTTDGGATWEARAVHDPGMGHSTINNQVVVLPDGTLVLYFTEVAFDANGVTTALSLAVMRSFDRGATWSERNFITDISAVGAFDPVTGATIRDGRALGQITADRTGRLFVVWQDARGTSGARDAVLLSRSDDRGLTWSAPVRVNADAGVAAFLPAVAITRDGTIGVSYFDFRSNTNDPATILTDVWLARSRDGGATWVETHVDGPFDYAAAPAAGGLFLGDYQGIATVGNAFLPFFGRANAGMPLNRSDIAVAYVAPL